MLFVLNIKYYRSNKSKQKQKISKLLLNKQEEVVNNGDKSNKFCANILTNFKPKFHLPRTIKKEKMQKTTGCLDY